MVPTPPRNFRCRSLMYSSPSTGCRRCWKRMSGSSKSRHAAPRHPEPLKMEPVKGSALAERDIFRAEGICEELEDRNNRCRFIFRVQERTDTNCFFQNEPARMPEYGYNLGSTGSLSRARTPKTHSWTRRNG